jgi:hypothetical protein
MKKVLSGKRWELKVQNKSECFASLVGIQAKKVAMAKNMMAIEVEKLRTARSFERIFCLSL